MGASPAGTYRALSTGRSYRIDALLSLCRKPNATIAADGGGLQPRNGQTIQAPVAVSTLPSGIQTFMAALWIV